MRKIINGKMYNTETAKRIGFYSWNYVGNFDYFEESLYRKKTGEFFLYGEGGPNSKYGVWEGNSGSGSAMIKPMSESSAKEWLADHDCVDEYIELFGEVEE